MRPKPGATTCACSFYADQLLLEVSAYPPSVDQDLRALCQWLREHFDARVLDDDGEPGRW